jgi:hypothetical protein
MLRSGVIRRPAMGRSSSGDFGDQGRIIIAAGPIQPPRYRPHAKAIYGRWPAQVRSGRAARPCFEVRAIKEDRNSAVNRPRQDVRVRGDHGAGQHGPAVSHRPAMLSTPPSAALMKCCDFIAKGQLTIWSRRSRGLLLRPYRRAESAVV